MSRTELTQESAEYINSAPEAVRDLVVDVTAVSGQSFFTGVQRIVREFCETHHRDLLLVKWDTKYEVFREVPRISRLRYRITTGFWGHLRVRLKNFYWNASKEYREAGKHKLRIPKWVSTFARSIYDRILSDAYIEKESTFHRHPIWQPQSTQTFLLLDIPVSQAHITALLEVMESHEVHTVVYLHDLFPLTHRSLFDKRTHPGVRAKHLRYLDVVSAADEVICNSEFTRGQYLGFHSILEQPTEQSVRVVYPPWPQFEERTDGSSEDVSDAFADATVRILAVGALDKRKNFIVLIRALELLVDSGVDARLVLVSGATAQTDPLFLATMRALKPEVAERVRTIRQVSDDRLVEIYNIATVVAVPSLAEGFGLPVVEALSRQRPVVAANSTALPELGAILPVVLADPNDAQEWADKLLNVSKSGLANPVNKPDEFPGDWFEFRSEILHHPGISPETV